MKLIIPMAGAGKRMRPHTLTTPKPLICVAGKPIVQRLVEDLAAMSTQPLTDIAFVVGHFGQEVEAQLLAIATSLGANGSIHYQDSPLGTAHAVLCAKELLTGNVIVAFADTLFYADFKINPNDEGIIYVQKVADPSAFGVVKTDNQNVITDFIEKPKTPVSDLAIIGIYYFKDGKYLQNELQFLVDNNIQVKGEYQLTDALENMKAKGTAFKAGQVNLWLDCGNKDATVATNMEVLKHTAKGLAVPTNLELINCTIIQPCFIGNNVVIENSVVGPYASIGHNTIIKNTRVQNCIIQNNAVIENAIIDNAMIGNYTAYKGQWQNLSIGDYTTIGV
jgi:glucose-1-phosphate thymidylyltransferase